MKHILLALLLVMSFNLNADDFDKIKDAYVKGNYEEAFKYMIEEGEKIGLKYIRKT